MTENLKFEIIDNGRVLRVTAENQADFLQFIKDHEEDMLTSYTPNSDQAFIELTESYWCNGWHVCNADDLGQMSQCLVICEDSTIEDNESVTLRGRAWTNIHNYQIVNPLDSIVENGYIDFLLWDTFKGENFPLYGGVE